MAKIRFKDFYKLEIKIDELKANYSLIVDKLDTLNTKIETNRINIKKILDWLGLDGWQETIRKQIFKKK